MRRLLFILFSVMLTLPLSAQRDTVSVLRPNVEPLIGASLFSAGALVTMRPELHGVEQRMYDGLNLASVQPVTFDNYLQFLPAAMPLTFSLAGLKGEHNTAQIALLTATSYLLGLAAIETGKLLYQTERPDGRGYTSFPSGHTFNAFMGAEILRREYGRQYPWMAYVGYGLAAVVGAMRIYNSRHWPSDVLGGAGMALLTVSATYALWNK